MSYEKILLENLKKFLAENPQSDFESVWLEATKQADQKYGLQFQ